MNVPAAWPPLESEVTNVTLTTAQSTEIDLSASIGRRVVFGVGPDSDTSCGTARMSSNGAGTLTTAKAIHPPGVYAYTITRERCFFQWSAVTTALLSYYIESGDA